MLYNVECSIPGSRDPGIEYRVNPESRDWKICPGIANTSPISEASHIIEW